MEIVRITAREFQNLFSTPSSAFNSVEFNELNKEKCIDIHYLCFKDNRVRLGIIIGEQKEMFQIPFSATYGGFSFNSQIALQCYVEACAVLKEYIDRIGKPLYIKMAPSIYDVTDNTKTLIAFLRAGANIISIDYNQHFELKYFSDYQSMLDSKTRNKLRNALTHNLLFSKLDTSNYSHIVRTYEVIRINHVERGNPLRMSLQNVINTIQVIPSDMFIVSDSVGHDISAAIVFHTTKDIYQVVYWGDIPSFSNLKSMNFLSYKVFEYYYKIGVQILDIGISTENGVPNFGLCEFKENIGCIATPKYTLKL